MFVWTWIFGIVLFALAQRGRLVCAVHLQHYTCEEFENGAYFDPYELLDSQWKIFYFWADSTASTPIIFSIPGSRLENFRKVVEGIDPSLEIEWHKATLFMEPKPGVLILLLYGGTPGAYRAVIKKEDRSKERPYPPPLIAFADVRMKIVDRYLGMMCCEDNTAYAMVRMHEMPHNERQCQKKAELLGFKGPGGRSYLYLLNLIRHREIADEL